MGEKAKQGRTRSDRNPFLVLIVLFLLTFRSSASDIAIDYKGLAATWFIPFDADSGRHGGRRD